MFEPMSTNKSETKNTFTAGLTFPELTLQVYQVTYASLMTVVNGLFAAIKL
jgi:hypothetical protein